MKFSVINNVAIKNEVMLICIVVGINSSLSSTLQHWGMVNTKQRILQMIIWQEFMEVK